MTDNTYPYIFNLGSVLFVQLLYSGSQSMCTPPVTMSTITCTTSSTNQSSNTRSMNCSVPANETISVTVTITNAAGVATSKSASAGLLAKLQKN